ncbi:AAA family ATPase [Paraburkholderia youngii]|uniref:AAA family ATPase n=1 Tax=Paraburkholderia youngii TaxID=2782701 RepID=UPI003D1C199B
MSEPTRADLDAARIGFWERVPADPRSNGETVPSDGAGHEPLEVIYADEIGPDMKAPPQVVEDLLCEKDVADLYGTSQSGKTTLTVRLSIAVATGSEFLGKRTRRGAVLYVASEAPVNVLRRIQGAKQHGSPGRMPMAVICETVDLFDGLHDVERIVEAARALERKSGVRPRLVVIDTLARSLGSADENATRDMGAVMRNLTNIANAINSAVVIVHHTGKDSQRGARGSSVIYSNADAEILCEHDEVSGIRTLTVKKQRSLGSEGLQLAARFQRLEVGVDEWGKPLTVSVVEPADVPQACRPKPPQPSGANQRIAAGALAAPLRESTSYGKGGAPPLWPCLQLDEAVTIVAASLTCEDRRRVERARQAIAGLVSRGVFGSLDGWLWHK